MICATGAGGCRETRAGLAAVNELTDQAKLVLEGKKAVPKVYPYQIAFNVLPESESKA